MTAVFGTGTSIVRTVGFSTVFGYRRCTRTWRESGSSTGANLMWLPAAVMSVSPARRAATRSRATSRRFVTGSGGAPSRSGAPAPPRNLEQFCDRLGWPAVPVGQLLEGGGDVGFGVDGGDPGVGLQPE